MPKHVNIATLAATGIVLATISACTTVTPGQTTAATEPVDTILLVSREDGSIVRQTVALDADICVKMVTSSKTTCLTEGPAVVNSSGIVVGYEMYEKTIDLEGSP